MDSSKIVQRLDALNIGEGERESLKRVAAIYDQVRDSVAHRFLQTLQQLIPAESFQRARIELEPMQEAYFVQMLNGPYDEAYANSRLDIGYVLYRLGIEPRIYVAAFSEYYSALILAIEPHFRDQMGPVTAALNKMLLFDTSLLMEIHFHEDRNRFRKLSSKYSTVIDAMHDGVVILDADSLNVIEVNHRIEQLTSRPRQKIVGRDVFNLHPPEFHKIIRRTLRKGVKSQHGLIPELYIVNQESDEYQPVEATYAQFDLDEESYIVEIVRDIKDRLSIQRRLARINRLYRVLSAVNAEIIRCQSNQGLFQEICRIIVEEGGFKFACIAEIEEESRVGPFAYCKAAYFYENIENTLGISANDDIEHIVEILKRDGFKSETQEQSGAFIHEKLTIPIWREKEYIGIPLFNDQEIQALLKIYSNETGSFGNEEIRLFQEIASDISYAVTTMANREHLEFLTNFDLLTRLPNRHLFKERIDMAVYSANYQKEVFATVLVDIDQFKLINDTFGYGFGDRVILEITEHLKRIVRPEDFVARVGSDEFALIFFNLKSKEEIGHYVAQINELSTRPIRIDGEELYLTLSAGVSLFPRHGHNADDLHTAAETAMKTAKANGGNTYVFYSEHMGTTEHSRIRFQNELKRAIHNHEFQLYYQPQIDLGSMTICGAEALIRWIHPQRGVVPPNEFIPVLEESYLIEEIGQWVLEDACRQIIEWKQKQIEIPLAINVSTKQITRNTRFFSTLVETIETSEIDPRLLRLEITESLIMENLGVVEDGLQLLREQGVESAIDDFGTGYSSLFYLKKLPAYALKIDRAFIRNLPGNDEDVAISSAIISMSRSLGKKTIAEGVETEEQLAFLKQAGCDMVQGFLFTQPLPADAFEQFYREYRND